MRAFLDETDWLSLLFFPTIQIKKFNLKYILSLVLRFYALHINNYIQTIPPYVMGIASTLSSIKPKNCLSICIKAFILSRLSALKTSKNMNKMEFHTSLDEIGNEEDYVKIENRLSCSSYYLLFYHKTLSINC